MIPYRPSSASAVADPHAAALDHMRQGLIRHQLTTAGLKPGMTVVDLWCGVGEVALLEADLVGPEGHVIAVDNSSDLLATAEACARQAGFTNITFILADSAVYTPPEPVDAIVARTLLTFMPDGHAIVKRLEGWLKPGGVLVF